MKNVLPKAFKNKSCGRATADNCGHKHSSDTLLALHWNQCIDGKEVSEVFLNAVYEICNNPFAQLSC